MPLPHDYTERVYAGVLGKIIGVYLGRPFEGWTYDRIMAELGPITGYVHERRGVPLVVTDDDLSGTFTFVRALPDHGNQRDLLPEQIGQTWLNYIVPRKAILWWGGMGNSTEHTAFLRLTRGIPAPQSGSIALNGKVVAEQIGAQIFIDGWAMVAPGDPELAADLARRASSVSHDGEAIHGAQVLAAMEASAFVESNIAKLLDCGLRFIPRDSVIAHMIHDVREWHERDNDWQRTRERIVAHYGYDRYGGNCHIVPNHALIILGLLYGDGDWGRSLMITNTAGWDTDCNSGNVGCLLGIRSGLAAFEGGYDWRGPLADQLFLPTADGGRAITDAVHETYALVNIGRALADQPPLRPKNAARFHFELPGAVQGFRAADPATLRLENVAGHSQTGQRSLALRYTLPTEGSARAATPTFTPPDAFNWRGYTLLASPTLYPAQTVRARIAADPGNDRAIRCQLYLHVYGANDQFVPIDGPTMVLDPGTDHKWTWQISPTGGAPIAEIGIALHVDQATTGSVYLDYMTWDGVPNVALLRPEQRGVAWRRAWVEALDQFGTEETETYDLIQNNGRGLAIHGTREWTDYMVSATLTPHLAQATGIAARVHGLRRFYALLLGSDGMVRLIKVFDNHERVLAEMAYPWELYRAYRLQLQVRGPQIVGVIDGHVLFDIEDHDQPLLGGAIPLICDEGRVAANDVAVRPVYAPPATGA